jgi:hypothetical protein
MNFAIFYALFSLSVNSGSFSHDTVYLSTYAVGETNVPVQARKFKPYSGRVTFINLHDNEQTSLNAAMHYLESCGGGKLVNLPNQQERFINISWSNKAYRFDPNRIYSREGRKYTLTRLSERFDDSVQTEVAYFASQILRRHIVGSKLIVAIHNNTDSALSILSYQQDQVENRHFGQVFINPEMDPDDFMLTTNYSIFKRIKERNINVVWENSKLIEDDGSLSVYAGLHKIPYINIEAEHEHLEEQVAMLNALDDIIKGYGEVKSTGPAKKPAGKKRPDVVKSGLP